jgi:uridine kinase
MPSRLELLHTLASRILEAPSPFVLRVAIDGVDGAGKTHFADELADVLVGSGRDLIRASVDGFHNPRAVRYRKGRGSPEGFYRDSYDYDALKRVLLTPLSPSGSGRYRTAVHDVALEQPVTVPEHNAEAGAILLLDGIFLHRSELRDFWDMSVWLVVPFAVSIARMARREGSSADPEAESNYRYVEGQRLYQLEAEPEKHATFVINNSDLNTPFFLRGPKPSPE